MEKWPPEVEGLRVKLETSLRMAAPKAIAADALDGELQAILDDVLTRNEPAALKEMDKNGPAWIHQAAANLWAVHQYRPPVNARMN